MRILLYPFLIVVLVFSYGCSETLMGTTKDRVVILEGNLTLTDISKGIPTEGLWRQNVILCDVNNDGFPEIITPPPRLASPENKKHFIFVWDQGESLWKESGYKFPAIEDYDYGAIAAGDINRDGYFDIVLATHSRRIMVLINDRNGGFLETDFSHPEGFHSRTVKLEDMNNDGWPDIVALSEGRFTREYIPNGILFGKNVAGKAWDVSILKEGINVSGDSLAIGDVDGDGSKDIIVAPLVGNPKYKRLIWFGDGKGGFERVYTADEKMFHETIPFQAGTGDIDGDGKIEVLYLNSGIGRGSTTFIDTYIWEKENLQKISRGIHTDKQPLKFTLFDLDGDARDELILASISGIHIFKYRDNDWLGIFLKEMDFERELKGIYSITAIKNRDGFSLIVYNGGDTNSEFKGIRAYILKWEKEKTTFDKVLTPTGRQ